MTWRPAALILASSVVCLSCAAPLLKLPAGPGAPASDAQDAVTAATAACTPVSSISLEMSVSGSIAGLWGWRAVFVVAALVMVAVSGWLAATLPHDTIEKSPCPTAERSLLSSPSPGTTTHFAYEASSAD